MTCARCNDTGRVNMGWERSADGTWVAVEWPNNDATLPTAPADVVQHPGLSRQMWKVVANNGREIIDVVNGDCPTCRPMDLSGLLGANDASAGGWWVWHEGDRHPTFEAA